MRAIVLRRTALGVVVQGLNRMSLESLLLSPSSSLKGLCDQCYARGGKVAMEARPTGQLPVTRSPGWPSLPGLSLCSCLSNGLLSQEVIWKVSANSHIIEGEIEPWNSQSPTPVMFTEEWIRPRGYVACPCHSAVCTGERGHLTLQVTLFKDTTNVGQFKKCWPFYKVLIMLSTQAIETLKKNHVIYVYLQGRRNKNSI